ncbi:MAG: hypothetical protein CFH18_00734, partial [Alphaproteobacteria bacterium MarineAlpha5_Bin8]
NRGYFSFSLIKNFILIQKKVDFVYFQFPLVEILPLSLLTKKNKIIQYHCLPAFVGNNLSFIIANIYFKISFFISAILCNKIITHTNDYFYSNISNYIFRYKTTEILPFIKYTSSENLNNIVINNNLPTFGFLGRICEEKGLELIIKSSNILNNKNIKHQIIIAGDLNDIRFKKYTEKILLLSKNSKSIKFIGKLREKDKLNFLHKIHVLLLPSTNSFEAFGLVQLEAMSIGKLVIASSLKGVRIPIQYTNNGLISKISNIDDLANQMINIIKIGKVKKSKDIIDSCMLKFNYNESTKKYLSFFN